MSDNLTFADYFTVNEMMELFKVESRYAIYTKGGIEEQKNLEPVKAAPKLRLYRVGDVSSHVSDKNTLETILARVQAERGGMVVGDWIPIRQVLKVLRCSRQWFHIMRKNENVRTYQLNDTILYNRHDIARLAEPSRKDKVLPI